MNAKVTDEWIVGMMNALQEYRFTFVAVSTNHPIWGKILFLDIPVLKMTVGVPIIPQSGVLEIWREETIIRSEIFKYPNQLPIELGKHIIQTRITELYEQ